VSKVSSIRELPDIEDEGFVDAEMIGDEVVEPATDEEMDIPDEPAKAWKAPNSLQQEMVQDLPHKFTSRELRELGDMFAAEMRRRDEINLEIESFQDRIKSHKLTIKDIESTVSDIAVRWRRGFEDRPTKVIKSIDYDMDLVTFTRIDTGEVYQSRKLNKDERQQALF
jgi:hypothetical protein